LFNVHFHLFAWILILVSVYLLLRSLLSEINIVVKIRNVLVCVQNNSFTMFMNCCLVRYDINIPMNTVWSTLIRLKVWEDIKVLGYVCVRSWNYPSHLPRISPLYPTSYPSSSRTFHHHAQSTYYSSLIIRTSVASLKENSTLAEGVNILLSAVYRKSIGNSSMKKNVQIRLNTRVHKDISFVSDRTSAQSLKHHDRSSLKLE
jgi:hypothetical protein